MGALGYELYRLGRRINRSRLLGRLIPKQFGSMIQTRLLPGAINLLPDRRYMEEIVLPAILALHPGRLLDIGIEHYSAHYRSWFPAECEFWTLDMNPAVAQFGSPGRHIVGDALDLASYFAPGSLDVILLNGAFGFGINGAREQERAVDAARTALRPDGWLLIGWDRAADGSPLIGDKRPAEDGLKDPLALEAVVTGFVHTGPGKLPARADFAGCSHVYDWFRRIA